MNWNLKDYGDPLEKKALSFIQKKGLGGYEIFWCEFIGNILGKPAKLEFTDNNKDNKRQLLGQWNYSILKNLFLINELVNKNYSKHKINKNNIQEVLRYDRDLLLVTQLTYNNLELLDKIRNKIKNKHEKFYVEKFNDFVNFRNLLTHNIKPLTKIGYHYEVPKNFNWFTIHGKDNENIIWSDLEFFKEIEYQTIVEYFNQCVEFIITDFKDILMCEFSYMKHEFNSGQKNKIVEVTTINILKSKYKPLSGTCEQ